MNLFDPETQSQLRNEIMSRCTAELMTDRERAAFYGLPHGCRVRERVKILAFEKLKCGQNVYFGEGALIDAQGGITIGDNCQIGINAVLATHTSHLQALAGETGISRDKIIYKPIRIGRNCFIAGPSVIGPGVTIGDGVVIAPMSYVDHDVPDHSYVNPHIELRKMRRDIAAIKKTLERLDSGEVGAKTKP